MQFKGSDSYFEVNDILFLQIHICSFLTEISYIVKQHTPEGYMQKTVCLMEGHWDSCIKDIAFFNFSTGCRPKKCSVC